MRGLGVLLMPILTLSLANATAGAGAAWQRLDGTALQIADIDRLVAAQMAIAPIPGLAIALVGDGEPIIRTFGQRDVAKSLPLLPDTVMYGASLTKPAFAYMVMQLVDAGQVDLDRSIADYLPKPLPDYLKYRDLAGDERWRRLTLRILLSHTSGFGNFGFLEPDSKLRFHRDPGSRYGYSGEGINLAQFVLETGLGLNVGAEMQARLFDRFGMLGTSMVWRDDFAGNLAQGYAANGALLGHNARKSVRAAGSMDTTPADFARFLAAVARGEGLTPRSKAEMLRRQVLIDSATQFPTIQSARTTKWRRIRLGYGIGWGLFQTRWGQAWFKEGHDDGTANYAICVAAKTPLCLLLMANSPVAEQVFPALVDGLLGPVGLPVEWEGYGPAGCAPPG